MRAIDRNPYYNDKEARLGRIKKLFDEFILKNLHLLEQKHKDTCTSLYATLMHEGTLTEKQLSLCDVMYEKIMKKLTGLSVPVKHDFKKKW